MKTLNIITVSIALILMCNVRLFAQDGRIDYGKLTTGSFYKVTLTNDMEVTGKLLKLSDLTIEMQTERSNVRIKKSDIAKVEKSHSILFMGNSNDTLTKQDKSLKTIILKDGSELIGHITYMDSIKLKFKTVSGAEIELNKIQIEEIINERSDYVTGDDPNRSRLFFAPTGRNLQGGTGYFAVNELLFPMLAFGITDYITVAGGISLLPGVDDQLYYFNGKFNFLNKKDINVSAGIFYTNVTSGESGDGVTVVYGNGTYGTKEASLTLGLGLSFNKGESSGQYPLIIVGGEVKVSNSAKLISENWIPTYPHSGQLYSFGVRFYGKKLAGDFGLFMPLSSDGKTMEGFPFIPWLGFNYNFDL